MVFHVVGAVGSYNGASLQALNLCKLLNTISEPILVSTEKTKWLKKSQVNGLTHLSLPQAKLNKYCCLLLMFAQYRPKLVHIHGFWIGFDILLLAWVCGIKTLLKTTLVGVDDLVSISKSSRLKAWIAKRCSINNALIPPIAQLNSQHLRKEQVVTIPNFVHLANEMPTLAEKQNIALVIGSVIKRKGVDKAIELFLSQLSQSKTNKLLIIGSTEREPNYYQYCLSLIPEQHARQIEFIGEISQTEVLNHLKQAKAIFQLSQQEGLPNAVLEAMAYNCVPIMPSLDGIAHSIIQDGKTGFILDKELKLNWEKFDELITSCDIFNKVKSLFSDRVVQKHYVDLYKQLGIDL